MSQVRTPLDGASPKRRRLRAKSRLSEVLLPSGALPVAHDAGRVAAAELDAGADFALFVAGRGVYKTFFAPSEYWVRKRVAAGRWPGAWPAAGFNFFRTASLEQRQWILTE